MKKELNSKGFGVVEALLIVVIIGVLGFAGWSVYQSKNEKTNTNQSQSQTTPPSQSKEVGADDSILDPTDYLKPYKLPQGWKEKECKQGHIVIIPPNTADPNCAADQPNTTIEMYLLDNSNYIDPENCAYTKTKQDTSSAGFSSYDCKDVSIDGKKGIREILKENKDGFSGEATYTSYIFPADGQLLTITYSNIKSRNDTNYISDFDTFVQTLKFQ